MPDPIVVNAPDPTPAPVEVSGSDVLKSMNAAERQTWRETGDFPAGKAPTFPGASSAPKPAEQAADPAASASTEAKPDSEPGKRSDPRAEENRVPVLLADRAAARDRAEKAEKALADLQRQLASPTQTPHAASSPAPAKVELTAKPDSTDYTKYPLGTSDPNYIEDLAGWKATSLLAQQRTAWEKDQADANTRAENQRIAESWRQKIETSKAKHPDFEDALKTPVAIKPGSVMDAWILESDYGPETLYHLIKNDADLARIAALPTIPQIEALVLLGHSLTSEPTPVKTKTTAPAPLDTLSSVKPASAQDETPEAALARGDSRAYRRLMNEKELAAQKK